MSFDASNISTLVTIVVGFAFAGFLASAFEALTARRASFSLLLGKGPIVAASIPLLAFSAPFIIMRNTLRGRRYEDRPIGFVMAATIIAGLWSLGSGSLLRDALSIVAGA